MLNWTSFLLYALVTAITPGPNNIMSMSNAGRAGFRKAFPFNLGIFAGFLTVLSICTVFLNALESFLPRIKLPMMIVGAVYMLRLAWITFRSRGVESDEQSGGGFWSGLLLQFINPKIYIYCIVSMEAYIFPFYHGQWRALAVFIMLLSLIGFVSTLCWSLFGSALKTLFSKYARVTNAVMALLLVYCALSLFF